MKPYFIKHDLLQNTIPSKITKSMKLAIKYSTYMFVGHQIKFRQQISFTWLTTSCASNLTSLYSIEISDKIAIRSITDVKKNDFTLLSSTDKKWVKTFSSFYGHFSLIARFLQAVYFCRNTTILAVEYKLFSIKPIFCQ